MQDTPLHLSSTDCTIPAVYSEQITKADDTQLLSLQSDALLDAGVDEERMYEDCASGRHDYRPGLEICLKALRRGNTFVIWQLDRLGRNLKHLVTTVEDLHDRSVGLRVLAGTGAEIDTTTANGRLIFGIFAVLAEFERELIIERTRAGLVAARARGRTGGRPRRMHVIMVHTAMRSMADRDTKDMFLTAISEAELLYGVAIVPAGKRRNELKAVMIRWPGVGFGERILPFDSAAARYYAEIVSRCRREGRPIQEADCQIAVISRSRSAVLATRNVRDFESTGVNVVDPWTVVRN